MEKNEYKAYEAPATTKNRVELEDNVCAGSEVSIEKTKDNVEVDEYISVENEIEFK